MYPPEDPQVGERNWYVSIAPGKNDIRDAYPSLEGSDVISGYGRSRESVRARLRGLRQSFVPVHSPAASFLT